MIEIKFRAWDKINKCMCYVGDISFIRDDGVETINVYPFDYDDEDINKDPWYIIDRPNFELMQFTGLKDKNVEDIYEGDKIKTLYGLEGIVEFNNGSYVCKGLPIGQFDSKEIEVKGNIYENKNYDKSIS